MNWLLTLLGVVVVLGGTRAALRPGGVEVNHVVLFSFGIGFYWLLPIAAGAVRLAAGNQAVALWYATWDAAARSGTLPPFLVFTLATYAAFLAGDRLGSRLPLPGSGEPRELAYDPRLLRLLLPLAFAFALLQAWSLRAQLFSGYRLLESSATGARGTLSAASLLLLVLYLLRNANAEGWPRRHRGWLGALMDPFLIAYGISATLVLSLGGRLYVIAAVTAVLVYHTVQRRPLPLARSLLIVLVAMILSGIAGTLRLGQAPSLFGIAFNLLAEPLFTSFSLLHFLAQNDAPWIAAPQFLLSDLLNLVPTAVLPTKAEYLLDPRDFGYSVFSPLGALNSYVSFTINFGKLGTPLVIFGFGCALAILKRSRTTLASVVYAMLCGALPFTFFRDAFSISVVKNMIQFSVLMPVLILWSLHVLTVVAPRRPAPADAAGATT